MKQKTWLMWLIVVSTLCFFVGSAFGRIQGQTSEHALMQSQIDQLTSTALQPPYTSISGRQITWAWIDSTGSLIKWTLPVDTYRAWVEKPKPTQTVNLTLGSTTWSCYDYRPYIVTDVFKDVVLDYSKKFPDGMQFAKEMFNLVTQLATYSSTDTARWPVETMTEAGGDCKDLSILFASLLKASNFSFQLRLVYMDSDHPNAPVKPNHSIIELTYAGNIVSVDCTTKSGWNYWSTFTAWDFNI